MPSKGFHPSGDTRSHSVRFGGGHKIGHSLEDRNSFSRDQKPAVTSLDELSGLHGVCRRRHTRPSLNIEFFIFPKNFFQRKRHPKRTSARHGGMRAKKELSTYLPNKSAHPLRFSVPRGGPSEKRSGKEHTIPLMCKQ